MKIEKAFAAIPNSTCLMRGGSYPQGEQHVKECPRCAAIRHVILVALSEYSAAAGKDIGNAMQGRNSDHMDRVRGRIQALGL